eukprot:TRINITY_DN19372_c0_g1_i2.p1 TRINITY_DN19372_c0_g1~~TRINITY_DN19372_c0_g1_i2.p1  ORF type:complete len:533 (+),score=57.59 TRINITY_DN19372_c0_g1_i2:76-1674(+)
MAASSEESDDEADVERMLRSRLASDCSSSSSESDESKDYSDNARSHHSVIDGNGKVTPDTHKLYRTRGHLEKQIFMGQRMLRRLRYGVSGTLLILGIVSGVFYELMLRIWSRGYSKHTCGYSFTDHAIPAANSTLFLGRLLFVSLAPLADDICLTRVVLGIDAAVLVVAFCLQVEFLRPNPHDLPKTVATYCFVGTKLFFIGSAVRAGFCRTPMSMQSYMWDFIFTWLVCSLLITTGLSVLESYRCKRFSPEWWWVLGHVCAIYFVRLPRLRNYIKGQLGRLFVTVSSKRAAAGIASLVGDCSAEEALAQASERFRSVQITEISENEMAESKPNPALHERTRSAKFGACNAFLSHSWHDDAGSKWAALQGWRLDYLEKHGAEPTLWLDKFCIDQNNIEDDLRCLPIFLRGCQRMVILCGTTYLSRLWCILEVFAFVHAGGDIECIDFVPVMRAGHSKEEFTAIKRAFARFDAQECECSSARDKERILTMLHAAFGCLESFNCTVRTILQDLCRMDSEHLSESEHSQRAAESD